MMSIKRYVAIVMMVLVAMVAGVTNVEAQYLRERGLVREGNRNFSRNNYLTSFNRYNSALEHDSTNYEALYNRANAHHQLRRTTPEDSTLVAEHTYRLYEDIAADTLLTATQRAEVLRNLGESLFADEKYEAALNSFRESLRLNPDDKETKYDYVLTKRIVDQKRQQQQQNQDNNQNQDNQQQQNDNNQQNNNQQNQDNNQNQDQNQQQNPEQDNQQGDEQQDNGGDEGENEPQQQPEGGERPQQLNSDQERMLDAIQAEEDKTQDKLKDKKKALIIPGKKNW